MDVLKLGIDQICEVAVESRSVVNDAIRNGDLETFTVGRRRYARPEAVRKWVDFLEASSKAGKPVNYRSRDQERRPTPATGGTGRSQ
jgi:hypothetical protein